MFCNNTHDAVSLLWKSFIKVGILNLLASTLWNFFQWLPTMLAALYAPGEPWLRILLLYTHANSHSICNQCSSFNNNHKNSGQT